MQALRIKLNSIEDVRNFVNNLAKFNCDFDLKSGKYTVDAKSLMGIFSMDLLQPMELRVLDNNYFEEVKDAVKDVLLDVINVEMEFNEGLLDEIEKLEYTEDSE